MAQSYTDADFERLSWHDCLIWGLELRVGDPDEGDWTSDLVLGIDYIVECICAVDRSVQFRIAPARLTFHGVTDAKQSLDWNGQGRQASLHHPIIDRITRERIRDQRVFLDRRYYRWVVALHSPTKGGIEFGAAGFSQVLLAEPLVRDRQSLTLRERDRLIGR